MKGKKFYAMHMEPGVCRYDTNEGELTVFIREETLKKMDASFAGCPFKVQHIAVGEEPKDLDETKAMADGYVVKSFYNPADGKHWAEIIAITEEGIAKCELGWGVSNCYTVDEKGPGGYWHDVKYEYEVGQGTYEHLAVVEHPRYESSKVLTPEEFSSYNERKLQELEKLKNSKQTNSKGEKGMLTFFKREKMENSSDLEKTSVILPKSKKEFTLDKIVNEMDKNEVEKKENDGHRMANADDVVEIDGEKLRVQQLVDYFENGKKNEADEKKKKEAKENESDDDEKKENESEDDEKNENESEEDEEKEKAQNESDFDKVKDAPKKVQNSSSNGPVLQTMSAKIARGKERY